MLCGRFKIGSRFLHKIELPFTPAWGEAAQLRSVAVGLVVLSLSGCSIFNPHVSPDMPPPYFPPAPEQGQVKGEEQGGQADGPQYAGGVVEAFDYAHAWQEEYYGAVGNDFLLRSLTVVPVVGAAAAALVLGITSSSPNVVAALSVGGAAALGTSLYLQSAPRQRVYLEGYKAINCAIAATGPYVMPTTEFEQFQTDLSTLRTKREELTAALNEAELTLGSGDEAVIAAKEALSRAATVGGNGQILSNRIANAGRNLTAKVDDIAAQVSRQITETEPDAQAITSLVSGLSGVTSIFGVAPPPPAEPPPPTGVTPQAFDQATDLRAKTRDLVLATDLVNERVVAADKAVEELGVLEACVPGDVVPSLVIRPRVDLMPVKPGQVYVFSAEGGAGPVTATFSGQMLGEIVQEGASFTLTVADDASGSSAIQFSDGETTRTITLIVDRGIEHLRPPPPQADTTALAPPDCAPVTITVDRTTLSLRRRAKRASPLRRSGPSRGASA